MTREARRGIGGSAIWNEFARCFADVTFGARKPLNFMSIRRHVRVFTANTRYRVCFTPRSSKAFFWTAVGAA